MAGERLSIAESGRLQERLESLEETYRATLNILEDVDAEKRNFRQVQQAMMNLLEDMHEERERLKQVQTASLNLLEDMHEERNRLAATQRALMNIVEDVAEERTKLKQVQKATMNLLEDVQEERNRLAKTQRALMNIVEDVEVERARSEEARALMEAANKELESFSYSVSHDLRAPLRAISGFAEAVVEDYAPKLDDEVKRYLGLIQSNANKMGQLIDDLLAFSRLSRQKVTMMPIDMGALIQEVFNELAAQDPERKIAFQIRPMPPAHGDETLIRQVWANLLSNAIKFTRTREQAEIEAGYDPDLEDGAYYVRDNGVGFDMQYAGKLFGVFERLHAETEFEGTGVGLALVARIINRHEGKVWAEAAENQGATFRFTLPKEEQHGKP